MNNEVEKLKDLAVRGDIGVYKKTYFVITENNFIRNFKYTTTQKMLYLCLQSYAGVTSSCFPSKDTIAKDLNISSKTVYTVLNQLQELGALLIINQITETNRKTSNIYILSEIDKHTGDFIPESISQFKVLTETPIRVKGV